MNKIDYPYFLKYFAYTAVVCISPLQSLMAQSQPSDTEEIQKATILNVIRNLEQKHVRPKTIDDNFSRIIWKKYLESLDPNKDVLLKSDFQQLSKYELSIDDELHEGSVAFFSAAYKIYQKRLTEAAAGYKMILSAPLDLNKKESVQLIGSLREYAVSQTELKALWKKKAKYLVLQRMQDLAKDKTAGMSREKQARAKVDKWLAGTFKNLTGPSALNERFSQYLNTVTLEVDPHTNYFAPVQTRNITNQMAKRFFGVGVELQEKEGDVFVKRLRPGGMAIKSGLVDVDDRILSISDHNGKMIDIAGRAIVEVADLIRGDKDTEVVLSLLKANGQEKTVSLKRGEIKDEEGRAKSAILEKDGQKIGYLFLPEFYVDMLNPQGIRSADDVMQEILKLKAENVKGIIFDLRNNGGGSLDEVVKMAGYFLGGGPKVQIKDPNGLKIHTTYSEALYQGPLVVMVNEQSASASEIFAAAIQDYKRGIIVGSPATYGKGTAQATLPMGKMGDKVKGLANVSYGSLRLTQHHFYRVNGASTQLRGVKSDVVLPGKLAYLKIREKDNITALQWDSIPALHYTELNKVTAWNNILNLAREVVKKDTSFKIIDENSKLLAESQLKPFNLNNADFMKQQERLLQYAQKIDQTATLSALKKIKVNAVSGYNPGTDNEWYQKWIEGLSTDLYILKTLDIINRTMIVK